MTYNSPTYTEYYIPFYQPRGFPSVEKVARDILNNALDNRKTQIYKSKSEAQAIAKRQNDGDGFSECFTIKISNPCGWGVFVTSDKDSSGVRCSDKVRYYFDIR